MKELCFLHNFWDAIQGSVPPKFARRYTDKEGLHTKEDITKAASKQEGQKTVDREIFSALLIL